MFTVVAAVARMERDLIAEHTQAAMEAKRRRGEKIGGREPTTFPSRPHGPCRRSRRET
ncbi:recombinase family protein [Streptomyces sp. NPDC048106]|uniref:recombinase family protein n=1 Tax=Streptomyces sp. NPDC048106 TaxID=3155750 RepID=UPI0034537ADB